MWSFGIAEQPAFSNRLNVFKAWLYVVVLLNAKMM